MLGFFIGAVCLIGLVKILRGGRHGRFGYGRFGRGPFGRGPRAFLNRIFARLDTSASQEKVIVGAVEEVRTAVTGLRGELQATRADVARLFTGATFDAERLGGVFARHDEELRRVREAVAGALAQIHGTLDDRQRETLAKMIETGPFGRGRCGGPYRQAVEA